MANIIKFISGLGDGYKTYAAGVGAIALGIYLLTQGKYEEGIASIIAGLAMFGLRSAIAKVEPLKFK